MPSPVVFHIYPSNKCQFQCSFCIMKEEKKRYTGFLKEALLFKAIKDAERFDMKLIHLSGGGEPLCHPSIYNFLKETKKYNIKIALSTNGYNLYNPELMLYVNYFRISLNAATANTHEMLTQTTGGFHKVIKNIEVLVKFREKHSNDSDIGIAFLITPQNWKEIYQFCWLAAKLKVDFVHIRPAYLENDAELMYLMPQISSMCEQAKNDFRYKLDVFFVTEKFDGYWTAREYDKCRATPLMAVLGADGTFRLCQDVLQPSFGDYSLDDFEEIWWGDEHKAAIENIELSKCPRCVSNNINKIIKNVFIDNTIRKELL